MHSPPTPTEDGRPVKALPEGGFHFSDKHKLNPLSPVP